MTEINSVLPPVAGPEGDKPSTALVVVGPASQEIKPSNNLSLQLRLLLQWRDRVDDGIAHETENFSATKYKVAGVRGLSTDDANKLAQSANYFYRKMDSDRRVSWIKGSFRPWSSADTCTMRY